MWRTTWQGRALSVRPCVVSHVAHPFILLARRRRRRAPNIVLRVIPPRRLQRRRSRRPTRHHMNQEGGSLTTSTRPRSEHDSLSMVMFMHTRRGGIVDATSVECFLSMTPIPGWAPRTRTHPAPRAVAWRSQLPSAARPAPPFLCGRRSVPCRAGSCSPASHLPRQPSNRAFQSTNCQLTAIC